MKNALVLVGLIIMGTCGSSAFAQDSEPDTSARWGASAELDTATVVLDGQSIVRVRGVEPYPARARAERIRRNIIAIAEDPGIDADSGRLFKMDGRIAISYSNEPLMTLYQADADLERVDLEILADATLERIASAIQLYRDVRSPEPLMRSTGVLAAISLAAVLLILVVFKLASMLTRFSERKVKARMEELEEASHRVIDSAQLWDWSGGLLRLVRNLAVFSIVLVWLNVALSLYPWTRPFAAGVFRLVIDPLKAMGVGVLSALPNIAFIVILIYIVRFVLRAAKVFFERVSRGWIRLSNFDREWAMPTFRIVRILIIAFALVVAYPYIPGSSSEAFKGVSLFLGVIFSIGSSSFIANIIAGYSLTYRRAFRPGDMVKIGELMGEVLETRMLSTRLRSLKNEEINIANQEVLTSHVVNYSSMASESGLILNTLVGIGYDTPWRQVNALLLEAAERTEGIEKEPAPFVLQRELGDFAVTYELNAYTRSSDNMFGTYSDLHANIQDVFNENHVQIMSPHYEGDPETPKLVRPEDFAGAT